MYQLYNREQNVGDRVTQKVSSSSRKGGLNAFNGVFVPTASSVYYFFFMYFFFFLGARYIDLCPA
jgi:hypothetical protein